jgi:hypothetical protein
LFRVLGIKSFTLDGLLVQLGVVENYNTHAVLEVLGVLESNDCTFPADFVLGLLPSILKSLFKLVIFFFGWNNFCTFFSNLVCSTWSFDLEINFLSLLLLFMFRNLVETFFSDGSRVLVSLNFAESRNFIDAFELLAGAHR